MKEKKPYQAPVSQFVMFEEEDVLTLSGWNNNGNGNGNGHWFEEKPGNGGHK